MSNTPDSRPSAIGNLDIETKRLHIRWLQLSDAEFVYQLVNDASWIRYIGDKSVSNIADAHHYLATGPLQMYRDLGHGLNRVALKANDRPIGICGLLKRESLAEVDLGFALLADYRQQGYAYEAALAVLEHSTKILGKKLILAIVRPENIASIRLLEKLGFDHHTTASDDSTAIYSYRAGPTDTFA